MEMKVSARGEKFYTVQDRWCGMIVLGVITVRKAGEDQPIWSMTNMTGVPEQDGLELAILRSDAPDGPQTARIVMARRDGRDAWNIRTLADLPLVYCIDILRVGRVNHLIAFAFESCQDPGDRSGQGRIYTTVLPEDLSVFEVGHQLELTVLKECLLMKRGYHRVVENSKASALICTKQGVLRCYPPEAGGDWKVDRLITAPAREAVMIDLDGDGELELLVLSPFQKTTVINIYKKIAGSCQAVSTFSGATPWNPFYLEENASVISYGSIDDHPEVWIGKPGFLGGEVLEVTYAKDQGAYRFRPMMVRY